MRCPFLVSLPFPIPYRALHSTEYPELLLLCCCPSVYLSDIGVRKPSDCLGLKALATIRESYHTSRIRMAHTSMETLTVRVSLRTPL